MEDKLTTMFNAQYKLQTVLGYDFGAMTVEETVAYIKEYQQHVVHELHEMLAELPYFKSWKKYPDIPEAHAYAFMKAKEEYVDALHFMLNVAIALGFSPTDICEMYMDKNVVNHTRQEDIENYKPCMTAAEIRDTILTME